MSILIKNRSIFKIIIYLGIVLLTTSCKEVDPREDTDVYTYMALTPKLISELGGVDSLYRYQFYLSNSFRLSRVDNEKSYAGQGMVNNIDNNYNEVYLYLLNSHMSHSHNHQSSFQKYHRNNVHHNYNTLHLFSYNLVCILL